MGEPATHSATGQGPFVGQRLRERREARRISLRALAARVGVSASLISQIENGKVMPSVGTLYGIVRELGLSMDDIFADPDGGAGAPKPADGDGPVQRADGRQTIYLASGVRWERLTREPDPHVDFLVSNYAVGAESCPADALTRHAGHEYGYLLRGWLGVTVGDRSYELRPGDSVSFPSGTPHRLWNLGEEPATAIWFVVGRGDDARVESLRPLG